MKFREQFKLYADGGENRIKTICQELLQCLYEPSLIHGFVLDKKRAEEYGIDLNEPVNWGAISTYVEKENDTFVVTIEEAAPDECPTLCNYFLIFLNHWGWKAEVKTEW